MGKRKKKRLGYRTVAIMVSVLLGVYLFLFLYNTFYPSYTTVTVEPYSYRDSIEVSGIAVREEKSWTIGGGNITYLVQDGDKIGKGSVVAEKFKTKEAAENNKRLKRLNTELENVESLSNEGRLKVNIDSVKRSINSLVGDFSQSISQGEYSGVYEFSNKLVSLLSSLEMATGTEIDTTEYEALLKDEIARLKMGNTEPEEYIRSDSSGYYVSYCDGCEKLISLEKLSDVTPETLEDLMAKASEQYSVDRESCKTIAGYYWYYVCSMSSSEAAFLREGKNYYLMFGEHAQSIPGYLDRISISEDGNTAAVFFEFDRMNSFTSTIRLDEAEIIIRDYEGIYVPRSAIRVVDGEVGVLIKYGTEAKFRRIDIVYEDEDYVISRIYEGSSYMLSLYDVMIVNARNIYAGKKHI